MCDHLFIDIGLMHENIVHISVPVSGLKLQIIDGGISSVQHFEIRVTMFPNSLSLPLDFKMIHWPIKRKHKINKHSNNIKELLGHDNRAVKISKHHTLVYL